MSDQKSFKGRVVRITFHNKDNGYTVARVEVQGRPGLTTVVGSLPGLGEGQGRFGHWTEMGANATQGKRRL